MVQAKRFISTTALVYCFVIFCVSTTLALFIPVSSLFFSTELHCTPFATGAFFTVGGIMTIIVSQIVAKYSDVAGSRKNIIMFGCLCGMISTLSFAFCRNYWVLLLVVSFINSFSLIAGQVFASGREYSKYSGRNPILFSSVMRAFWASAWIICPPAAMFLLEGLGFKSVYLVTAAVFLITLILVKVFMPATNYVKDQEGARRAKLFAEKSVLLLFIATVLIFTCNNMYLITMPQYVTVNLGFSATLIGVFMATAASCEIPIMLLSGYLSKKIHMKYLLIVATISGILYYIAISYVTTVELFLVAQLANAVFIGIITSLDMVYFQEMLPKIPGQATTLFTNAIAVGNILSGLICGAIAEMWGFVFVFQLSVVFCLLAFVHMCFVRKI